MNQMLAGYSVPQAFLQFEWHKFAGQKVDCVTYMYLSSTPIPRLSGQSSVLYIGETEQFLGKRYKQETGTKNTAGNSQATNIRLSHVVQALLNRGDKIDLYFTPRLSFKISGSEVISFGNILKVWNKNLFLKSYVQDANGNVDLSIEKYLLSHYADAHWEVPPLNNSG